MFDISSRFGIVSSFLRHSRQKTYVPNLWLLKDVDFQAPLACRNQALRDTEMPQVIRAMQLAQQYVEQEEAEVQSSED
jgi:hypothetical protein